MFSYLLLTVHFSFKSNILQCLLKSVKVYILILVHFTLYLEHLIPSHLALFLCESFRQNFFNDFRKPIEIYALFFSPSLRRD